LHRLSKNTEDVEAKELRRVFTVDVLEIEKNFWTLVEKVPEPVSVTNPMGDKLTDTATVQTIKFALRRQSKRVVYSERMEQRLSECFPDPEAEPLNFEDFQSLYRALLSNCADLVGWSPLHWACNRGAKGAIQCLIDHNASVDLGTKDDLLTPVHEAARAGHVECLALLCEMGANLESQTVNGNSAMHYAAKYGQIVVMQYLNLKNVNIAAKNQMGWTPFHQAARHGQTAAAKEITHMGGGSKDADRLGLTARALAEANGHKDVVDFIDTPLETLDESK